MPGIIEQIQQEALDPKFPVATLLRKVKLAASKLKLEKVEDWVDNELRGYTSDVADYRRISGLPRAWNSYRGWIPIGGEPRIMEIISKVPIGQPIAGIESSIALGSSFIFDYPADVVNNLSDACGWRIPRAGAELDRAALVSIVDAVRTLILEWALALENAGVTGFDVSFSQDEKKKLKRRM